MAIRIERPYYPIVYVRGYAMTEAEREDTFHDAYYGFSANSVEKRDVAADEGYFALDVFEGQLIRFMKAHEYVDGSNHGLELLNAGVNPSRSIWINRFYDKDVVTGQLRSIVEHAKDLQKQVCVELPAALRERGVDLGPDDSDYRVILIAHSMGGLVCRTLIQNLLPSAGQDPKRWVHRLVTMGTPHGGIEMDAIPEILQKVVTGTFNAFDAGIFQPDRMRQYLLLPPEAPASSLGPEARMSFPPNRCLCIVGSDYKSYGLVRKATGNYSDGLVKQNNAKIDGAYFANVHRAHSGYRGIVNSYESFENLRRFLFGNIRIALTLEQPRVKTKAEDDSRYFYDVEFHLSIRGTGVYLHRRQQDPCENAMRFDRKDLDALPELPLHTAFMNSRLRLGGDLFSHFLMKLRVLEHRVKDGLLWDHDYPERAIYNEMVEIRVGDADQQDPGNALQVRWLSDSIDGDWQSIAGNAGTFRFALRQADSFSGTVRVDASGWDG